MTFGGVSLRGPRIPTPPGVGFKVEHGVSQGSSPRCGAGPCRDPLHLTSGDGLKVKDSEQAQTQGLHSFYSLTSLLIKWFAPLEVIVSPPRSPGSPYQRITNLGLCTSQQRSKNQSHQISRRCRLRPRQ